MRSWGIWAELSLCRDRWCLIVVPSGLPSSVWTSVSYINIEITHLFLLQQAPRIWLINNLKYFNTFHNQVFFFLILLNKCFCYKIT